MTKGKPSDWAFNVLQKIDDAFHTEGHDVAALILDEARAQWEREVVEWLRHWHDASVAEGDERPTFHLLPIAKSIERGAYRTKP